MVACDAFSLGAASRCVGCDPHSLRPRAPDDPGSHRYAVSPVLLVSWNPRPLPGAIASLPRKSTHERSISAGSTLPRCSYLQNPKPRPYASGAAGALPKRLKPPDLHRPRWSSDLVASLMYSSDFTAPGETGLRSSGSPGPSLGIGCRRGLLEAPKGIAGGHDPSNHLADDTG